MQRRFSNSFRYQRILVQPYRPFNNKIQNANESRLQIKTQKDSNSFYTNITRAIAMEDRVLYDNQTLIPNALKKNEFQRKMIIQRLRCNNCVKLKHLIGSTDDDEIDEVIISVPSNGFSLLYTDDTGRQEISLSQNLSYQIRYSNININKVMILSHKPNKIICIELIKPNHRLPINSQIDDETLTPQQLCQEIFLATRFVYTSLGLPCLAAVSIVDINGYSLLQTYVCPRERIMNYATAHGGITEDMLLGQPDGVDIYQNVMKLLKGNIIIGCKVLKQLQRLRVDPKSIIEIRDITDQKIKDNQPCSLKEIAEYYHFSDLIKTPMSAIEETNVLRILYNAIQVKRSNPFIYEPLCEAISDVSINDDYLDKDIYNEDIQLVLQDEIVLDDIPDGDI